MGLLAVVTLAGAAACSGDDDDGATAGDGPSEEPEAPPQWPLLGNDLASSRSAPAEDTVGPDNVDQLAPAWQLEDVRGVTGTPIVVDGVVYVGDWTGQLRALDAATGEEVWHHDLDTYYVGGAAAVDGDQVFVATFEAQIVALDRATGEVRWTKDVDDQPAAVVFGSPIAVDGMVIVGLASAEEFTSGAEASFHGNVVALDAETGDEIWRYFTSPESATESPGVSVWSTVTVDTEREHVYVTTGNSYGPEPSDHGDAVIALDLTTGEELWLNQFTGGDTWTLAQPTGPDADIGGAANLFQVGDVDALGVADKAGHYHAVARDDGELLWETNITPGGLQGGVLATAAADGEAIYVASNKASTTADLVALDDDSGEVLWRTEVGASVTGPVSVANGVVYVADDGGHIAGYDAGSGEQLWSHEVPAPAAGGISIVDGTVYGGYGWWLAAPPEDPKGGLIAFRLDGDAAPAPGEGEGEGEGEGDDESADGEDVYRSNCARCHGGSGQGGSGPTMEGVADRLDEDEHLEIVREGREGMPAWEDTLSDEEIQAVVDYEREVLSG
jgi:polyvinyl alcohol dehydrogenase (cytochrome)